MDLLKFTDLDLAELQGRLYGQLMQIQSNLLLVNNEIQRRKDMINQKKSTT